MKQAEDGRGEAHKRHAQATERTLARGEYSSSFPAELTLRRFSISGLSTDCVRRVLPVCVLWLRLASTNNSSVYEMPDHHRPPYWQCRGFRILRHLMHSPWGPKDHALLVRSTSLAHYHPTGLPVVIVTSPQSGDWCVESALSPAD